MPVLLGSVPQTAIAVNKLASGQTGLNANVVRYCILTDGTILYCPQPYLHGGIDGVSVNSGATQVLVTPTSGKKLWLISLKVWAASSCTGDILWSGGTFIFKNRSTLQLQQPLEYNFCPPEGLIAPAINETLQFTNRNASTQTIYASVQYAEV